MGLWLVAKLDGYFTSFLNKWIRFPKKWSHDRVECVISIKMIEHFAFLMRSPFEEAENSSCSSLLILCNLLHLWFTQKSKKGEYGLTNYKKM